MTTEATENTPETTSLEAPAHDHSHEGHDHSHDDLEPGLHTHHNHGPSLNPECTREVEVTVPADEVAKSYKRVIKTFQKHARIPGFRAGKIPESLIRSKFAREIRQDVLESLVSEKFRVAIEEQKVQPISQPQIVDMHLVEGDPLKFKAAFEVLPEFDVAGYDTIKIEKPDVAVTEDEYEGELARVLDQHSAVEPVEEDRALVEGDWAEIEFKGEIKDVAQTVTEDGLENASPNAPITGDDVLVEVGGKNTLAAFNDALRGSKPGQELTFEVDYPADFGEPRLAGKTVAYDVKIKSIKKKIKPELNAEFAKQLGDYESYEDFTSKLREHLASGKKQRLENIAQETMVNELVAKFDFPVPESFVQQQVDARLDRGLRALAQQGMTADDMRKLDFNRLRAAQRDAAVGEVKASLILDKVAKAEGIDVAEDDVEREILMASIQSREPLDEIRARLAKDGGIDRIREQLRREKTGQALYAKLTA